MELNIYTDGACSQGAATTNQEGGWGMYVIEGDLEYYGAAKKTTNNIMEMTAFLRALNYGLSHSVNTINIYSDSAYILNCFKQKWYVNWEKNGWRNARKEPVKNKVLWELILSVKRELESEGRTLNFIKVKGHSNDIGNIKADVLAVRGREEAKRI